VPVAKKAAKRKQAKTAAKRKTTARQAPKPAAKKAAKKGAKKASKKTAAKSAATRSTASKRPMPTRTKTKAARQKTAARSTASRKAAPAKPQSTLATVGNIARGVGAIAIAAVASRMPWAKNENDPIRLLETDHRRFEKLLDEGEATTERAIKGRGDVLKSLTRELTVHEAIEEQILYPALRSHAETHDIVLESIEEHHVADLLIKELHEVRKDNEQWGAKFKVLKESITHHIEEEETNMFRAARAALGREELMALGVMMRALKAELEK
jgi:hemerythrin